MAQVKEKDLRISVRVSSEIKKRLEAVEKTTGVEESLIVRQCIEAFLNYVEEHGEITFPLVVLPKSKVGESAKAKPPTEYRIHSQAALMEDRDKRKPQKPKPQMEHET